VASSCEHGDKPSDYIKAGDCTEIATPGNKVLRTVGKFRVADGFTSTVYLWLRLHN
jgi:hypothetical protein